MPPSRRSARAAGLVVALLCLVAAPCATIGAQVTTTTAKTRWFGIDSLRFGAVGVRVGAVKPLNIESTTAWGIEADYGEIRPGWRVAFSVGYWGSRFTDAAVQEYADSLTQIIDDPTGDATVVLDEIDVQAITIAADLRRVWAPVPWFQPHLGGGIASHLINADGPLIDGTFVERAVDNVVIGVAGLAGATIILFDHLAIEAQARYDLFSLARFASVRGGISWYFERSSRSRTP